MLNELIKRKIGGYGTAIPLADNAPLTLSLICPSNGFVCSKSSSVSSSSFEVSCWESLSSSLDVASSEPLLSSSSLDVASSEPPSLLLSSLSSDPDEPEDSSLLLLLSLSPLDDDSLSPSEVLGDGVIGALSSADPDKLEVSSALLLLLSLASLDNDSSLLPDESRGSVAGVEVLSCAGVAGVEVLSCAGRCEGRTVEVMFCANTELWVSSIVISVTVAE